MSGLMLDEPGRGRVYDTVIETVGNTPLVRLQRLARQAGCAGEVLAKLEFHNPAASVKDRIAVSMLEALQAEGAIHPGSVIVEPTAGNTGIALAFVCAARDLRCVLTMPAHFSVERQKIVRLLGAELILTPADHGILGAIDKANELVAGLDDAVMPWQYGNPANADIHRRTTAEEIWRDTGGAVDAVVIGVGTGGTLTGVAELLKMRNPDVQVFAVEPERSPVLSGGEPGPHGIQGIGTGFVPEILNVDLIDEVLLASDEEAMDCARKLALVEGIPGGISSGAAVACALRVAARPEMSGSRVVTLLPSCAERYLSTALFSPVA